MGKTRILIVDDDREFVANLERSLQGRSYEVYTASNRIEAEDKARASNPDVVILGTLLPRGDAFEFHKVFRALYNFCTVELSSFYLDVSKDRLYTYAPNSKERRSCQTAMYEIVMVLAKALAPIAPFTAEEIWQKLKRDDPELSVHAALWPEAKEGYIDRSLEEKWEKIFVLRPYIMKAIEEKRAKAVVGDSMEASVTLYIKDIGKYRFLHDFAKELAAVFVVSQFRLEDVNNMPSGKEGLLEIEGLGIHVEKAAGLKCERCWTYSREVGSDAAHPTLCKRCSDVLKGERSR